MEGRRAPQGLDIEDKLAFGLTATHLAYVVLGLLAAYTVWGSGLPGWLRYPCGAVLAGTGALMGWGRVGHRPMDRWVWLAARYWTRPRRSPAVVEEAVALRADPVAPRISTPRCRRVLFFSLKGGVGKTALVAEVAAGLARAGVRTAAIDFDLANPCLSTRFGTTEPTLQDAIAADAGAPVAQYLAHHGGSGVRLLLGALRPATAAHQRRLTAARVVEALDHLAVTGCEVALIDTGREVDSATQAVLESADVIYLVVAPTPTSVHAAYRAVAMLARLGLRDRLELVFNMAQPADDLTEVVGDLGLPLAATVPADEAINVAELEHVPASLGSGNVAVEELVRALTSARDRTTGLAV